MFFGVLFDALLFGTPDNELSCGWSRAADRVVGGDALVRGPTRLLIAHRGPLC